MLTLALTLAAIAGGFYFRDLLSEIATLALVADVIIYLI
jgi:hypothetical protein